MISPVHGLGEHLTTKSQCGQVGQYDALGAIPGGVITVPSESVQGQNLDPAHPIHV